MRPLSRDYSASPLIELSGNGGFAGLTFAGGSGDSSVSGLAVNRFLTGISLQTSGIKVERSYFGLAPNGSPAGMVSVQQVGVEIKTAAASNNTIGGVGNLMNVISNNTVGVDHTWSNGQRDLGKQDRNKRGRYRSNTKPNRYRHQRGK
ncbi:MAG: hypothetical protein IPG58_19380 [Acidobacteria bacterium]|nr:hypothetical protein [Acidobacteriota bacterium]